MKPVHYRISVFAPGSIYDALGHFESHQALMPIRRGDLLNPTFWPGVAERGELRDKMLRVVGVEHGIQESDEHILHVIDLFTEATENVERTRIPGWIREKLRA